MINPEQFRIFVVRPTLKHLDLWSQSAENLLIGTALVESKLTYLKQFGAGPALGVFQIEPVTFDDIYFRYLKAKPVLAIAVQKLVMQPWPPLEQLTHNLALGCAIARCKYLMDPQPLPDCNDITGLGQVWKRCYNTLAGAGTVEKFVTAYRSA